MMQQLRLLIRFETGWIASVCALSCSGSLEDVSKSDGAGHDGDTPPMSEPSTPSGSSGAKDAGESGPSSVGSQVIVDSGATALPVDPRVPCLNGCSDDVTQRPEPTPAPRCPSEEPSILDECALPSGSLCSYGSGNAVNCRRYYECDGDWREPEWKSQFPCFEDVDDGCPGGAPTTGEDCVIGPFGSGYGCGFDPALTCYCEGSGTPNDPGMWACYGPPSDPRCPAELPNLGAGCNTAALNCNYAVNGCFSAPSSVVLCFQGEWQVGEPLACAL